MFYDKESLKRNFSDAGERKFFFGRQTSTLPVAHQLTSASVGEVVAAVVGVGLVEATPPPIITPHLRLVGFVAVAQIRRESLWRLSLPPTPRRLPAP